MKKFKYFLMAMLAVLAFAACEEKDDENKEPQWTDYFSMQITKCERVGDNLKVDFNLKNISGKDVQKVGLNGGSVWDEPSDDLGNKYSYVSASISGGDWMTCPEFNLAKGESVSGSFLIEHYDRTNSSKKFNLVFNGRCQTVAFDGRAEYNNISVIDNRILKNGFDTNDQILTYKAVSCKVEQEKDGLNGTIYNNVLFTYQVTNKSSKDISQFAQNVGGSNQMKDNTGDGYNAEIAIADGNYSTSQNTILKAGETKTYTVKVKHVRDNATAISGSITCPRESYPWADTEARFYDISITK